MSTTVPIVDYLELGDEPRLVAKSCSSCGALYFDRRNACARCGGTDFDRRPLAGQGKVRTFTIVQRAAPGVKVPYVSAVVDLDGGGSVKSNLVDVEPAPEQVTLGMPVRLVTYSVGTDDQGTEAVAFGFAPA
ncbi:MAG TPA: OB-fold domain-containing protein [Acidimicrobiales bacterium]|nr:OB-fold domain-containing protein [Acidimicrobiales bacterium]